MTKATYKDSGVDLDIYRQSMARLPRLLHKTYTPRVIPLDGGFAGLFQLDFANKLFERKYEEPVLVSCTDGVGTKLKVATMAGRHNTVGIDLVAMSVNDALCCGAEPLFFLDYVAMSHDDPVLLEQIVTGITDGCMQSDCALLGGETAIMPDIYQRGDYDLAGFVVGVVEKKRIIDGKSITPGDVLIGIPSSGLHSNGFSLVRKIVFEMAKLKFDDKVSELDATVADALLVPTKIYAKLVRKILNNFRDENAIHGISHITGGGLLENFGRILPEGCRAVFDRNGWQVPAVFQWLQKLGNVDQHEMDEVFNMGIGLVLCVSASHAENVIAQLTELGEKSYVLGKIESGEKGSVWK